MRPKREGSALACRPVVTTQLGPNDVLIGRGSPATGNKGNIRFREVIRSLLPYYVATSRRSEKDRLARQVIDIVRNRQGRFVRRVESPAEADRLELDALDAVWILVEDEAVIPKVKQTFRDQNGESSEGGAIRQQNEPAGLVQRGLQVSFCSPYAGLVAPQFFLPSPWNFMPPLAESQGSTGFLTTVNHQWARHSSMSSVSVPTQSPGMIIKQHELFLRQHECNHQNTKNEELNGGLLTQGLDILAEAAISRQTEAFHIQDASFVDGSKGIRE